MCAGYPGVIANVVAQAKPCDHMIEIAHEFGLGSVALGPIPFLGQRAGEFIGVLHAFNVAARAGVAIPEPRATSAATGFKDAGVEALLTQTVQHVESGKTGADDDRVERCNGVGGAQRLFSSSVPLLGSNSLAAMLRCLGGAWIFTDAKTLRK